jgi:C-terminal peptidase prc
MRNLTCKILPISFIFLLLLTSCETEKDDLIPLSDQERELRNTVVEIMRTWYLWNEQLPQVSIEQFNTVQDMLGSMVRADVDRWTYMTDAAEFDRFFTAGEAVGVGIGLRLDPMGDMWISFVQPRGPAGRAGLARGMKILRVNGTPAREITNFRTAFGEDREGVVLSLEVQQPGQEPQTFTMTKGVVSLNTVLHHSVIERSGKKIGYMVFNNFIAVAAQELNEVVTQLKNEQVEELVLDLRYNGGGMLSIAQELAGLLAPVERDDQLLVKLEHNKNRSSENQTFFFRRSPNSLNLKRIVIITSGATASASEVIINGLKPFMPVVTVGANTYGKPVGSYGFRVSGFMVLPITFRTVNALGEADYFQGIPVNSRADDDLSRNFGDVQEASLAEAIRYLETGAFSSSGRRFAPSTDEANRKMLQGFRQEVGMF